MVPAGDHLSALRLPSSLSRAWLPPVSFRRLVTAGWGVARWSAFHKGAGQLRIYPSSIGKDVLAMEVFCGTDWAEQHHDIAIVDPAGRCWPSSVSVMI